MSAETAHAFPPYRFWWDYQLTVQGVESAAAHFSALLKNADIVIFLELELLRLLSTADPLAETRPGSSWVTQLFRSSRQDQSWGCAPANTRRPSLGAYRWSNASACRPAH
jgi:hypothetical protein